MTPAERALFLRVQRRIGLLTPEVAVAVLAAFSVIRDGLDETALRELVAIGAVDRLVDQLVTQAVLASAYQAVREQMRGAVRDGFRFATRTLPPPPPGRTLAVAFDVLNPRVVDAIRTLESRVITTLTQSVRDTVKQATARALADGVGPRVLGRELRAVIGLAPNQETAVANFRRALLGENPNARPTDYQLRDRRYDRTVAKGNLTEAQVETMTAAYRKRMLAFNAETNARTATLDAFRLGQRLSWEDAIAQGIVDRDRLMRQRIGVADARERPEHVAINDEVRPFDVPYSNGELVAGDQSFNCRCIDRFFVA